MSLFYFFLFISFCKEKYEEKLKNLLGEQKTNEEIYEENSFEYEVVEFNKLINNYSRYISSPVFSIANRKWYKLYSYMEENNI